MSKNSGLHKYIEVIENRRLPEGGFVEIENGCYRPDSTVWAILALEASGSTPGILEAARDGLQKNQAEDGRVSMPQHNDALWPTTLAILAWYRSQHHKDAQRRALAFLLETKGKHWKKEKDSPVEHDTSIPGWPWTQGTHSWIEPTSMALIALEITGNASHRRFDEGIRMIMDRQLPRGGWNYGNKMVYGQELHPFVDTTGIALTALAGHVKKEDVTSSLKYLRDNVSQCRTPLSISWALFGLGAWGEFQKKGAFWIEESLRQQDKYGAYRTSLLSLLVLASICQGDFRKCFA
jgi:hypothetical protein